MGSSDKTNPVFPLDPLNPLRQTVWRIDPFI